MRAFKTEGIILKRRNFGEADRILTVFTPFKGKISVLAKGVRRITSRRGGNIELLNKVIIYLHQTKGMPILTEAKALETYPKLKQDLTLSTYAFHILELVDKMTAENQENRVLYTHLVEVLSRLEKEPRQILIRAFEAKALSNLGFVSFVTPGVSAQSSSKSVIEILKKLESLNWSEIEKIEVSKNDALELERILRYHVERVIEGSLKSRKFLKKIR
ncbi:DNA repair protein RecO [Candidatus Daviesbacteria bacterium]|nr:DNA repair protein RecO [Candidatus Daviesbacteria bacterium]